MPTLRFYLCASLAGPILLTSACKKSGGSGTQGDDGETVAPGSQATGPIPEEADYGDLGWSKEGTFTKDGDEFSGVALQKHDDGSLKGKYELLEGRFDGTVEEWYPNGTRSTLKMYKDGKRHGVTTYWDEAGVPIKLVVYENDEEVEEITDPEKLKKIPR